MKMTKDELITKQQLEIEEYKNAAIENEKTKRKLIMQFFAIGAPLNDNVLRFNKEQLKWCFEVAELVEQLDTIQE